MVSSISYKLAQNKLITGFGARRCATRGRGIRSVVGNVLARPALTFIANKVADLISGSGKRRTYRKRTVRGSSWRVTGTGRKPRSTLTRRRKTGAGVRKPRKTLLKRVHRRIMF